jgi:hypothetical protein
MYPLVVDDLIVVGPVGFESVGCEVQFHSSIAPESHRSSDGPGVQLLHQLPSVPRQPIEFEQIVIEGIPNGVDVRVLVPSKRHQQTVDLIGDLDNLESSGRWVFVETLPNAIDHGVTLAPVHDPTLALRHLATSSPRACAGGTSSSTANADTGERPPMASDLQFRVEAMGLEPTNLLTASQALYQLSYAPVAARSDAVPS